MAADRRYRQQNRVTSDREKFYVYGNAVRQAEVQPKEKTGSSSCKDREDKQSGNEKPESCDEDQSGLCDIFHSCSGLYSSGLCGVHADCRQKLLQDQLMLLRCRKNLRT